MATQTNKQSHFSSLLADLHVFIMYKINYLSYIGGRGLWTVYNTSLKSSIIIIYYSLAYILVKIFCFVYSRFFLNETYMECVPEIERTIDCLIN